MTSHLGLLVVFAILVSTVFAVLQRDSPAEQVRLALLMSCAFIGSAVLLGWLMYPFPLS